MPASAGANLKVPMVNGHKFKTARSRYLVSRESREMGFGESGFFILEKMGFGESDFFYSRKSASGRANFYT